MLEDEIDQGFPSGVYPRGSSSTVDLHEMKRPVRGLPTLTVRCFLGMLRARRESDVAIVFQVHGRPGFRARSHQCRGVRRRGASPRPLGLGRRHRHCVLLRTNRQRQVVHNVGVGKVRGRDPDGRLSERRKEDLHLCRRVVRTTRLW
jgi:hypothetical protein